MPQAASYSFLTAKAKIESYCAYQERAPEETRLKLHSWGLKADDVEALISHLIAHNFLNEERFAKAFAGGKFRIKKWGKVKIKIELKKRKISDYCIRKGLAEIDEQEYDTALRELIQKKLRENKKGQQYQRNYKAAQYALSRGFESDLIWEILKDLEKN